MTPMNTRLGRYDPRSLDPPEYWEELDDEQDEDDLTDQQD